MYSLTTNGIKVNVEAIYVPQESRPNKNYYVYSYQVTIINKSSDTIQLLSRQWIITDSFGRKKEVKGEGVIGQQPIIEPLDSFSYQSWCPLNTKVGSMHGKYFMQNLTTGESIDVEIPKFILIHDELEN